MNCELIFNSSTKKCAVRNISQSVSEAWMTVDGTPLMPGKEDILHNDSLIKICASDGTETDIIAEVSEHGMYHEQDGSKHKYHEQFRIPSRKEMEIIFTDAIDAQEAKAAVVQNAFSEIKAIHSVLEWTTFRSIIKSHPDIFGPNWPYKSVAAAYVRFRLKCREAGLDATIPLGSLQDMVLEGQNAVGCRLEIFWNDGQSRKSDLDLQPYLIFAKLTTKETTATRETKSVERHELFQENRIKKGSWYSGVVDLYNPKTKKYHFTYDDKGKILSQLLAIKRNICLTIN